MEMQDYIIVRQTDEGHLKPVTFADGSLIVYSTRQEAEDDMGPGDMLAEINVKFPG